MLQAEQIQTTYQRIQPYLHETPLLESRFFNQKYGH
jgi:threonine dehydratase